MKTALCCVALACFACAAQAEDKTPEVAPLVVEFSTMTCKQLFEKTANADRAVILFWLNGYIQNKTHGSTLDMAKFSKQVQTLAKYCAQQPETNVLSAAEKTF